METVTFANSQTLSGHLLESNDRLWIYLNDVTLAAAYEILSIPENTSTIRSLRFGKEIEVTGYNHLYCISEESNNMVSAGLKKVNQSVQE